MSSRSVSRFASRRNNAGFTLIELLTVIVIIGILAGIAIPLFLRQRQKAVDSGMKSDAATVITALKAYRGTHDVFGSDETVGPGQKATTPALADFGFQTSPGNTLAMALNSDGWCFGVTNPLSSGPQLYTDGPYGPVEGCTLSVAVNGFVDPSPTLPPSAATFVVPIGYVPFRNGTSPVCTNSASAQAKFNHGCPVL